MSAKSAGSGGTPEGLSAAAALELMLERVAVTEAAVRDRFPLYAAPETGEWTTTVRGSWVAGFWVGTLWLRARWTRDARHRAVAEDWTRRLAAAAAADTVTRGLTLWYGAAAGHRLGVSDSAPQLALEGAEQLAATFDPQAGILPWGTAFGAPAAPVIARVDGLAGTIPLLAWTGTRAVAERHLATHLRVCSGRAEWIPALSFAHGRWEPCTEPAIGWSRGDAWRLLALADAGLWLDTEYSRRAVESMTEWPWPPTAVPAAVRGESWVIDTSAASIMAVALCKLGRFDQACELAEVLVGEHLSAGSAPGRLLNGCYDLSRGVATGHELIWGDFFLMLALAMLSGEVDPAEL
ncbi:hypothetical protein [Nocardia tengchongensis]|uniref:hypothetical protein n=1 Tax=Nocardia tengchongensis TaxID=2055889 RepID=UPI0036AA1144